jgi:hypothetical protein
MDQRDAPWKERGLPGLTLRRGQKDVIITL